MSAIVLMALPVVMFIGLTLFNEHVLPCLHRHAAGLRHDRRGSRAAHRRRLLAQPDHQTQVLGRRWSPCSLLLMRRFWRWSHPLPS